MKTYRKTSKARETGSIPSTDNQSAYYQTTTFCILLVSAILFLGLSLLYLHAGNLLKPASQIDIPDRLAVCTVLMMLSLIPASRIVESYESDQHQKLLTGLTVMSVFWLTCGIIITLTFQSSPGLSQLTPLSWSKSDCYSILNGLFVLQLATGLLYMTRLLLMVVKGTSGIVNQLLYFTNPVQAARIRVTAIYWQFTTAIWVFLYFLFVFTN